MYSIGVVVYASHPRTQEAEAGGSEFEANLRSSKTARAT